MNPVHAIKYLTLVNRFKTNHPKLPQFIKSAGSVADVGTVAEITVKTTTGKTLRANILINEEDMKIINEFKALRSEQNRK